MTCILWAFDSIFRWTYGSHCYLLLHSNNTQLWWLQHGQRSSPETGSPGFRKNSWHLDNFRHQDPQVATHHFINMTKSQIINSNMKLVWQLIRRLSNTLRLRLDSPIFCPLRAAPSKIAVATGLKSTLKSQLLQHHVSSRVLGYTTVLICSSPRELTMFWASKHWKISPRKIMCSSFLGPGGLSPKSASLQLLSHVVICWLSFISLVYIGVSLFCRCGVVFVCRMLSSFPFGMLSPPKNDRGMTIICFDLSLCWQDVYTSKSRQYIGLHPRYIRSELYLPMLGCRTHPNVHGVKSIFRGIQDCTSLPDDGANDSFVSMKLWSTSVSNMARKSRNFWWALNWGQPSNPLRITRGQLPSKLRSWLNEVTVLGPPEKQSLEIIEVEEKHMEVS